MLEGEPWPCQKTMTSQAIALFGRWRIAFASWSVTGAKNPRSRDLQRSAQQVTLKKLTWHLQSQPKGANTQTATTICDTSSAVLCTPNFFIRRAR